MVVAPAAGYACGGGDSAPATTNGGDAAAIEGGQPGSGDGGDVDAGFVSGTRCTQAELDQPIGPGGGDFTAMSSVEITFPTDGVPAQYTNRCAKVKVGTTVTFSGSFANHPLEPNGGDKPTPIPADTMDVDGGGLDVTMTTPGIYGFECAFHPTIMFGAVQVVP
jgi:plastocyanin